MLPKLLQDIKVGYCEEVELWLGFAVGMNPGHVLAELQGAYAQVSVSGIAILIRSVLYSFNAALPEGNFQALNGLTCHLAHNVF